MMGSAEAGERRLPTGTGRPQCGFVRTVAGQYDRRGLPGRRLEMLDEVSAGPMSCGLMDAAARIRARMKGGPGTSPAFFCRRSPAREPHAESKGTGPPLEGRYGPRGDL